MAEEPATDPSQIPQAELNLLRGVDRRIYRAMAVLGAVGTLLCSLLGGLDWGAGFLIGAALSALNFHWMKSAVGVVAETATAIGNPSAKRPPSVRAAGAVVRFALRYVLIGVAAYVIFKSPFVSLGAFFLGLFLFLGAILVEVAFQLYLGFRNP